jgi:hypothetical protein
MSPRSLAIAVSLSTLGLAPRASAQQSSDAAHFAYLEAPPPPPAPAAPAPAREGDEYARKSWEAFPEASFGAPFCRGDSLGAGHCGNTGNGAAFGGGALYRLSPYVALGASVSFASFQLDTPAPAAYSRASFVGLLVRGYFADRGAVDPYLEAGIGRGAVAAGYSDGAVDVRSESSGPSSMAGAGIDFWLTPYLKLGPALSYRWTWLTDVRTCAGPTCETAKVGERGAVGSYVTLGLHATIALGHEM